MFYSVLPALGPVGWALSGAVAGVALVKALSSDESDRTVTVVQSPPSNAKRKSRKRAKERAAVHRVAERLNETLEKVDSRLDAMQIQINDLEREPRHPESGHA